MKSCDAENILEKQATERATTMLETNVDNGCHIQCKNDFGSCRVRFPMLVLFKSLIAMSFFILISFKFGIHGEEMELRSTMSSGHKFGPFGTHGEEIFHVGQSRRLNNIHQCSSTNDFETRIPVSMRPNQQVFWSAISNVGDLSWLKKINNRASESGKLKVMVFGGSIERGSVFGIDGCGGKLFEDCDRCKLKKNVERCRKLRPPKEKTWPQYLKKNLENIFFADASIEWKESIVGGAKIDDHLRNLAKSQKEGFIPDLVITQISANFPHDDFKPPYRTFDGIDHALMAEFERFYRRLLQLPGKPFVLDVATAFSPNFPVHGPFRRFGFSTFQDATSILSRYYKFAQISLRDALRNEQLFTSNQDKFYTATDKIHPTSEGHLLWANIVVCSFSLLINLSDSSTNIVERMLPKAGFYFNKSGSVHQDFISEDGDDTDDKSNSTVISEDLTANGTLTIGRVWESFNIGLMSIAPLGILEMVVASFIPDHQNYGNVINCSPKCKFLPQLEITRMFAAVHIVLFHYYQEIPLSFNVTSSWVPHELDNDEGNKTTTKQTNREEWVYFNFPRFGKYWVQYFFLISGFFLSLSALQKRKIESCWLRWFQVFPLHVLAIILACLAFNDYIEDMPFFEAVALVLLVHAWFPPFHNQMNGASWFLSTLTMYWMLFPKWLHLCQKIQSQGGNCAICAMLMVWISSLVFPFACFVVKKYQLGQGDVNNFIEFSPFSNWAPFFLGIQLAVFVYSRHDDWFSPAWIFCGLCVSISCLTYLFIFTVGPGFAMGTEYLLLDKGFFLLPVYSCLLLSLVFVDKVSTTLYNFIALKPFVILGNLSWPIYILHQPVHKYCVAHVFGNGDFGQRFLCYPCVLLFASFLAYYGIHKPWSNYLRNHFKT